MRRIGFCKQCGKALYGYPSKEKKYCSIRCRGKAQSLRQTGAGNFMYGKHPHRKSFSLETRKKMSEARKKRITTAETRKKLGQLLLGQCGERNRNWKGGISNAGDGYFMKYAPGHPRAYRGKMVLFHRLILEEKLGRYLLPNEIAHHIDFDKTNNDPDNLLPMVRGEHLHYHQNINRLFEHWLGA